ESDVAQQVRHRAALSGVINEFRSVFADMTLRAASAAAEPGYPAASALAPAGLARYRHGEAYLVGEDGALLASFPQAASVPLSIARTVAEFRAAQRVSGGTGVNGDHDPGASDFAVVEDRPALVAVAAVRASGRQRGSATLVRVIGLDRALIGTFETMSGVAGL